MSALPNDLLAARRATNEHLDAYIHAVLAHARETGDWSEAIAIGRRLIANGANLLGDVTGHKRSAEILYRAADERASLATEEGR